MTRESGPHRCGNADYPWDSFDATRYFEHNYRTLRADDAKLLAAVRDFFGEAIRSASAPDAAKRPARGLDIGTGSNLYPALTMLPFAAAGLTLWEYSARSIDWLRRQVPSYSNSWDPFWELLTTAPPYQEITDPRAVLTERARVRRGSIFDLPAAEWDIGTMFFVAESLSSDPAEFAHATRCFVRALRPAAPFAAAFMENSTGYDVGDLHFPAVAVTVETVRRHLENACADLHTYRVGLADAPLRDGYSGMILALGTVAPADPTR